MTCISETDFKWKELAQMCHRSIIGTTWMIQPFILINFAICMWKVLRNVYFYTHVNIILSDSGKCMWNVGVKAGDSRDFLGQKRFFPFTPENVLIGQDHDGLWMWNEGMVQRIGRTNHDDEMWNEGLVDTFDECKLDPPGPYPDWYKNYLFYKEVSKNQF